MTTLEQQCEEIRRGRLDGIKSGHIARTMTDGFRCCEYCRVPWPCDQANIDTLLSYIQQLQRELECIKP